MTPGARLAAVLELAEEIEERGAPADMVVGRYLKGRRYIGGKDRQAITDQLYGLIRRRGRLDWWIKQHALATSPRMRLVADLALQGEATNGLQKLFDGRGYNPTSLSAVERRLSNALQGERLEPEEMPPVIRLECPRWAEGPLRRSLGEAFETEMRYLRGEAPVDLRVNLLKGTREEAQRALVLEGIETAATEHSPWGLRLPRRAPVTATAAFRDGLFEVQDEGSQVAALAVDAAPGQQVLDLCAGAGGKTLALAAIMNGRGRLVACDVEPKRLERLRQRARRAGAPNIDTQLLDAAGNRRMKRQTGRFDRVLVDAPCTGTGTWRRNPDARWSRGMPAVAELTAKQDMLLNKAARLVKPGGKLVYVTCSLLAEENEDRVEALLAQHPALRVIDPGLPGVESGRKGARMTPARHNTDGFFVCVMEQGASDDVSPAEAEG